MMKKEANYDELRRLLEQEKWPKAYMFKFIVPFDADSLNTLKSLFSKKAKIVHKESKTSKYISFTAMQTMQNPEAIIDIYKQTHQIDKIIAL